MQHRKLGKPVLGGIFCSTLRGRLLNFNARNLKRFALCQQQKPQRAAAAAEHNGGQILLEVERIVKGACAVDFIGRLNGTVITPQEILKKLEEAE